MDIQPDDVVYVIAIRARAPDQGRSVRDVLDRVGEEIHHGDEYAAQVMAVPLAEAYHVENRPGSNQNNTLRALGFDFGAANQIVPVVTESPA